MPRPLAQLPPPAPVATTPPPAVFALGKALGALLALRHEAAEAAERQAPALDSDAAEGSRSPAPLKG